MIVLAALLLCAQPPAVPPGELAVQLLSLRRVYVDRFSGGESAAQIRDMVIASMQRAGLFVITENPERADAVIRGSGEDLIFTDTFQSGETLSANAGISLGRGGSSRSGRDSAALRGSVSESENTRIAERKHEASASVRIVNKDGDVIWSTTQESQGGKFRSAGADVADRVTRQLTADVDKARAARKDAPQPGNTSTGANSASASPNDTRKQ